MPETEMFDGGNSSKRAQVESILSCSSLIVLMQRARLRGEISPSSTLREPVRHAH